MNYPVVVGEHFFAHLLELAEDVVPVFLVHINLLLDLVDLVVDVVVELFVELELDGLRQVVVVELVVLVHVLGLVEVHELVSWLPKLHVHQWHANQAWELVAQVHWVLRQLILLGGVRVRRDQLADVQVAEDVDVERVHLSVLLAVRTWSYLLLLEAYGRAGFPRTI